MSGTKPIDDIDEAILQAENNLRTIKRLSQRRHVPGVLTVSERSDDPSAENELAIKRQAVEILRQKLAENGMTQTQLCRMVNLATSDLCELLGGRRHHRYSVDRINRFLAPFDVRIETSYQMKSFSPDPASEMDAAPAMR